MQSAIATGDLLDGVDTDYLNLIAVNTAKWYEADDDKFKHYLALMHYGMDEEILSEAGIDVGDAGFQEIREMLMRCCVQRKIDEAKKEGDEEMEKMLSEYLIEKGRAESEAELLPLLNEKEQQLSEKNQRIAEKDQRIAELEVALASVAMQC